MMMIDLRVLATVLYALALIVMLTWASRQTGDYDFGTPIVGCGTMLLLTIGYLLFWVVYLTIK